MTGCGAPSNGPAKIEHTILRCMLQHAEFVARSADLRLTCCVQLSSSVTKSREKSFSGRRAAAIHQGCAVCRDAIAGAPMACRKCSSTPASISTANMSDIFFDELGIRKPDHTLGIHGGIARRNDRAA